MPIYSILIAIVLRSYNEAVHCHCWFLFFLRWACKYANVRTSDKKINVESLILRWPLWPVNLLFCRQSIIFYVRWYKSFRCICVSVDLFYRLTKNIINKNVQIESCESIGRYFIYLISFPSSCIWVWKRLSSDHSSRSK